MITRTAINERVREWSLREDVVKKDYVLGWLLWGLGASDGTSEGWVFRGGTCLKKCYLETYRFSEDLDFTVLPGGPVLPEELGGLLPRVLQRVTPTIRASTSADGPPCLRAIRRGCTRRDGSTIGAHGTPPP